MALAGGGQFSTVKPHEHSSTNATIIEAFATARIHFAQATGGEHIYTIGGARTWLPVLGKTPII